MDMIPTDAVILAAGNGRRLASISPLPKPLVPVDTKGGMRKISDGILLYRVEIGGLNNSEAANTTWDVALINRWLALETREEKRSRLSY